MSKPLHVTDFLWDPEKHEITPFCILFGKEAYLKHLAFRRMRDILLNEEDAEFSLSRFTGSSASYTNVLEEVSLVPMFGGSRRLVLVEDADPFVSRNRERLEEYIEKPSQSGVLLLLLETYPTNTKLYKKSLSKGFILECSPLPDKELSTWALRWAKQIHRVEMDKAAADLLISLVGSEMGMLDQEIGKLALMVPEKGKIDAALVEHSVGSWRTRTIFEMLDCALDGKTVEAIRQLHHLFLSGENAVGILAQISYSLRKLGQATHLILESERSHRPAKMSVSTALSQVGVRSYFLSKTESQLKKLGRLRGAKLSQWLLQAEADLKGASRMDPRIILETLLFKISEPRYKHP